VGSTGHRGAQPAQEQLRHEQQRSCSSTDHLAETTRAYIAAGTALVVAALVALAAVVSSALQSR